MKRLKSYVLHVDFMDILSDEKYMYLAIRLGESTEYGWLHRVIAEFLIENGMDNEDINELLLKVSLSFTNMHSLMALKAHMQSKPCWKTTKNDEKTLTAHGRISFWLLISDVLNKNTENISYNGKFKEDDILMGEKFCWIYSKQLQNQPNMSYLADLSSTWTVMQSYYEIHLGSETYPQNLNELMDSLQLIGFHPSVVRNPAYIAFMRYHPSIASSIAKRTLTTELRRAVRDQGLENEHFLSRVPIGAWQQWEKKYSRNEWAEPFRESISPVIKGIYWYDPSFATSTSKGQQGPAKTTGKGQLTSISKGPSQVKKISAKGVATSSQEEKEKFPNTVWGMFDYKRCVIEHGMEHAEGQFVYESASSVEIHASGPFSGLLAYLLYTMLKNQLFRKGSRLRFIFKTYKALFGADDD